jgi:hypothetical protein
MPKKKSKWCEWVFTIGGIVNNYYTSCYKQIGWLNGEPIDYTYCPYCSKPIKVVKG